MPAALTPAAADLLLRAAAEYGTPAYIYDLDRVRATASRLRSGLPAEVRIRYSVKANPAAGLCRVLAEAGLDAEVSSAGELAIAIEAGFPAERILVSGPYKDAELLARLAQLPAAVVSVDSVSELEQLAAATCEHRNPVLLRLRPDYPVPGDMPSGPAPRFGIPLTELPATAPYLGGQVRCAGFHVHGGSQILDAHQAARQLADAHELAARAAGLLGLAPAMLNLGGGFGVPYSAGDTELDLDQVAAALRSVIGRCGRAEVTLELGRYLVADAGWYLTTVVHKQSFAAGPAFVVDGGVHHRPDLCGLDLACRLEPVLLGSRAAGLAPLGTPDGRTATAVLGCLCLPWDVLAYAAPLPGLRAGDVLAFPAAGAYGLTAAPAGFLGHRLPAEVALDGGELTLLPSCFPSAPPARRPAVPVGLP